MTRLGTLATVKRGDIGLPLEVDISYARESLDLTGDIGLSTGVVFIMTPVAGGAPTVNRVAASVVSVDTSAKTVTVRYDWAAGQTDTSGTYKGEFEFDLTGGAATAPTDGYLEIRIVEDLG